MPPLRPARRAVLNLISDTHFSSRAPVARAETDAEWLRLQADYLEQVTEVSVRHDCAEVVCAGDLFHRWHSSPELINHVLRYMPKMYAVPGQHDLPHHNYQDIQRSAYWTLVEAQAVKNLVPGEKQLIGGGDVDLYGFPWGFEVTPPEPKSDRHTLRVAVVHAYCWIAGKAFPGVTDDTNVVAWAEKLKGYDLAVFGDNHKSFVWDRRGRDEGIIIYNHGTLIRRHSDERNEQPGVGVLYDDGSFEVVPLDTSADRWADVSSSPIAEVLGVDAEELLNLLKDLGSHVPAFREAVWHYLAKHKVAARVQEEVTAWLEAVRRD